MKRAEQRAINEKVLDIVNGMADEMREVLYKRGERLRYCTAEVVHGVNGFWLRSYRTIVAFIPYESSFDKGQTCFDFLRYVYGFTTTSAQHIRKFADDYGNGKVLSWKFVPSDEN